MLNAHPDVFCPAEIKFHADLLGQFPGDPLAHVRLGASIEALDLPRETWLDAFGGAFVALYQEAARRADARRWADKTPENAVNAHHWDRLLDGRMAFVLLVRHPVDVVASMGEAKMDKTVPTTPSGRAEHWVRYTRAGLDFARAHPARSRVIAYEDLASDPEGTTERLCRFLDLPFDQAMIRDYARGGGPGRLEDPKVAYTVGVHADSIGRGRRELDMPTMEEVVRVAGPLMEELGYHA